MAKLYNLARMTTATTGTGTITLGSASSGYLTFAQAGVVNTDIVAYGIKDGANSEVGVGTYTSSGTTLTRGPTSSTNSNAAISLSGSAEVFITPRKEDLPPIDGRRFGLTLSTAGGSSSFGIAAGWAADGASSDIMRLDSAYTKATGAWSVGSGGNSLDTGTFTTGLLYYVYLIKRVDTGVVDVLTSLSATAPTMPTNYTLKRRIGAMRSIASVAWAGFTQVDTNFYLWAGIANASGTSVGTSRTLITSSAPPNTIALMRIYGLNSATAGTSFVIQPTSETDRAPGTFMSLYQEVANQGDSTHFSIPVDASSQFAVRASAASSAIYVETYGWIDNLGMYS